MAEMKCVQTVNIWGMPLPRAFWKCTQGMHGNFDDHRDCGLTAADRHRCEAHQPLYEGQEGNESR